MSPTSNPHISSLLRQLIYYHLDNNLLRNALFLAGRLHAHEPRNSEASYLLALCQFQGGQVKAAYDTVKTHASRAHHLGCSYIFAQACLELGRYVEGTAALDRCRGHWVSRNSFGQHSEIKRQHLPDAAAVYTLAGKLWNGHKDHQKAVECWVEALNLNPFMWDAFQGICDTGSQINISRIYELTPEKLAFYSTTANEQGGGPNGTLEHSAEPSLPSQATTSKEPLDPFLSTSLKVNGGNAAHSGHGCSALWEKLNGSANSMPPENDEAALDSVETPSTQVEDDTFREPNAVRIAAVQNTWEPPQAPARKPRTAPETALDFGAIPPPKMRNPIGKSRTRGRIGQDEMQILQVPEANTLKRTISGQVAQSSAVQNGATEPTRRSDRLLKNSQPNKSTNSKPSSLSGVLNGFRDGRDIKKVKGTSGKVRSAATNTVGRVVSGNRDRKHMVEASDSEIRQSVNNAVASKAVTVMSSRNSAQERMKESEALQYLLELLSKISTGYYYLTHYRCQDAITTFNSLSSGQRETPWVLSQIGRAYFEQAAYPDAEKFFVRAKQLMPSKLDDMEYYSTTLWHMKADVSLAYLAHELMEVERLSPQAWCAIGNSFSLQREHDQALKCFKRATQLDPNFAYGFTLQGHEYMANEEYDKALDAYRGGISADRRHYNAWYGLGKVYEKMGKYDFAEQHYRTAQSINPANAVLLCCIGMVLEKMKNPHAALDYYTRACNLAPTQALSRFKKARVLMALNEPEMALDELKTLKDLAPDEANVHFLLGRLYKMLREKGEAIKCFTTALNLDPKAAQYIKDAMESLDDDDDEEEDQEDDMD